MRDKPTLESLEKELVRLKEDQAGYYKSIQSFTEDYYKTEVMLNALNEVKRKIKLVEKKINNYE